MSDVKMAVTCRFYLRELRKLRKSVACVSAGRLAGELGISRSTAKKYLNFMVRQGWVSEYEFTHVNGQPAIAYIESGRGE